MSLKYVSKILLTNTSYLDVNHNEIYNDQFILIKDGLISKITNDRPEITIDKEFDLSGTVLLPGFIDAHVHVNAIQTNLNTLRYEPPTYVTPKAMKILEEMLMRGFTTVRDAAGADFGIAKAVEEDLIVSPRIIFGGPALSPTGGHGDSRSSGDYTGPNQKGSSLSRLCDGISEVRKASRDIIRSGGKHIKIMASGGVASPTDRIDSLQFSEEEILAIVEEANNANIYVMAHTYTAEAINRALRLGVRSIEHGNLLDKESIKLFLEHDAYLVPTLITYYALKEEGLELGLPQESYDKISSVLENGKNAIRMAYDGGVKLVFGTDLLGKMHRRQLEEFKLLTELMEPIDIIKSTTTTAAELLQMDGEIGEIKEGAKADLLVYSENPLDNMDILQDPDQHLLLIMKEGKIYMNEI